MRGQGGDDSTIAGVLRKGPFRYLWIAQIFSQIANNTLLFLLALRIFTVSGSNAAVSGLFLVYGLPAVVFGMIAGSIVDKLENKTVLLWCDFTRALIMVLFIFFPFSIPLIYLLMFVNAVITQFYVPAEAPTIPYLVGADKLVAANSLFSFTYFSSLAIGSVLAGPLMKQFGSQGSFVVLFACYVLAGLSVTRLPLIKKVRTIEEIMRHASLPYLLRRVFANMREGLSIVRQNKKLSDALVLLLGTQVIFALLGALGPGFAVRVLGIDVNDVSFYVMGPVVVGILTGTLLIGSVGSRFRPGPMVHTGILSAGAILVALSLLVRITRIFGPLPVIGQDGLLVLAVLLFLLLGAANSLLDVPSNATLQEETSGEVRGRIYGLLTALVGGVGILPVVIGGVLADVIGVGKVVFLLGSVILLFGVWRVRVLRL